MSKKKEKKAVFDGLNSPPNPKFGGGIRISDKNWSDSLDKNRTKFGQASWLYFPAGESFNVFVAVFKLLLQG